MSPLSAVHPGQDSSPSPLAAFGFVSHGMKGQWPASLPFDAGGAHHGHSMPTSSSVVVPHAQHGLFPSAALYGPPPYSLEVKQLSPLSNKSRVETQITVRLSMASLPAGVKRLHLPRHTVAKPKFLAKPPATPAPDMLEMHTRLVCTSALQDAALREQTLEDARVAATRRRPAASRTDPEGKVYKPQEGDEVAICAGCMARERKRSARKKVKKPEDEEEWLRDEGRRAVVFNKLEIQEWLPPHPEREHVAPGFAVEIPMRITCYCRHHGEKVGFTVIYTLTDHVGNFIAQSMSQSIMITDDHKTSTLPPPHAPATCSTHAPSAASTAAVPLPVVTGGGDEGLKPRRHPSRSSQSSQSSLNLTSAKGRPAVKPASRDMSPVQQQQTPAMSNHTTPRALSRPVSPSAVSGPLCKKRKSNGSAKIPGVLAMTPLESPSAGSPSHVVGAPSSAGPSPLSQPLTTFPGTTEQPLFGAFLDSGRDGHTLAAQPPRSTSSAPSGTSRETSLGPSAGSSANAFAHLYAAPLSTEPSRAPSPSSAVRAANAMLPPHALAQALANGLSTYRGLPAVARQAAIIYKIIPAEGPKTGGIEVTVLGQGFYQGLEVMFGDVRAPTTTYWGETSLVCLLPPSAVAGTVQVTFTHEYGHPAHQFQKKHPTFKYVDDDEQQLMRTALGVLSHKMNGTLEDVMEVARRIRDGHWNPGGGGGGGSSGTSGPAPGPFAGFSLLGLEAQLSKVLELIDRDDSMYPARFNLRRSTGQSMLHLGCALNLHHFVGSLISRGADIDLQDKGGYTPLHIAALNDLPEMVGRLLKRGADPTIRNHAGDRAADVARSKSVLHALLLVERTARSNSATSLRSRASSASSLKSMWDAEVAPKRETLLVASEGADGASHDHGLGSETASADPEDDSDEGAGGDDDGLHMRRNSTQERRGRATAATNPNEPPGGLVSPAAALAALREQFTAPIQQFQQAMMVHFPNLTLPQMPEYQAAMAATQRFLSMVPNIGGLRPGLLGEPSTERELDVKWWDAFMPFAAPPVAPPPPYEEVCPREDFDRKQASAAQAATEAEADMKCATRYDPPRAGTWTATSATRATSSPPPSAKTTTPTQKLPALLEIGKKNAITREQQENLRRAHAEKLKKLSRDKNLFCIWVCISRERAGARGEAGAP